MVSVHSATLFRGKNVLTQGKICGVYWVVQIINGCALTDIVGLTVIGPCVIVTVEE